MIKTNIKMRVTPEQSKRVQEICFSKNIMWCESRDTVILTERPFLYIFQDYISSCDSESHFKKSIEKEIDADLFIKTNGTCEEIVILDRGAKSCDMLQSENKKLQKKIENLHIALNKKVAKNKNQKEEINLLLKQKENYKQLQYDYESLRLQSNKKMKDVQNDFMNIVNDLNKTIDLLEDRIKEKETIISYLESKLK